MATELYANSPVTTVSSGGTTAPAQGTTETWTVASSAPFPAAATGVSQFHVADPAAGSEIIAVTNVSGTTWTVTRGAESTTPVTHLGGFTIWQVVTAADLTGMLVNANNLSDVQSAATARANLGLGAAALLGTPVPVASGGTGQVSQQAALDALAGAQTSAQFLRGNGTHVLMSAIQAADVPTLNQNTTGTAANITGTLDTVPAPAAAVSLNSKKITSLANGSAASDAAAFGQLPVLSAADTSAVVAGTATAPTVRTGTLDVVAAQHPPAADWSNNSHKITSLANGSGAQDAAAFGQVPVADATAANILPLGTQAAGANGKWADSGHVHPQSGGFFPADAGLLEWNYDPAIVTTQSALPTSGQITLVRVNVRVARSVTNVLYYVGTIGSVLTSGQCFAGLYNSSGTLIGTSADQATAWAATTGLYTTALTGGPFNVPAGFAWVAFLFNGTTGPAVGRSGAININVANSAATAAASRFAHTATGAQTSLTSFTPSANVQTAITFWAALS